MLKTIFLIPNIQTFHIDYKFPSIKVHLDTPFNSLKHIEKALANALLLQSSTLALGLVEIQICVWAPELASLRVQILLWTQGFTDNTVHPEVHTRIQTLRLASLQPRPRSPPPQNPMLKWNSKGASHGLKPSQFISNYIMLCLNELLDQEIYNHCEMSKCKELGEIFLKCSEKF